MRACVPLAAGRRRVVDSTRAADPHFPSAALSAALGSLSRATEPRNSKPAARRIALANSAARVTPRPRGKQPLNDLGGVGADPDLPSEGAPPAERAPSAPGPSLPHRRDDASGALVFDGSGRRPGGGGPGEAPPIPLGRTASRAGSSRPEPPPSAAATQGGGATLALPEAYSRRMRRASTTVSNASLRRSAGSQMLGAAEEIGRAHV